MKTLSKLTILLFLIVAGAILSGCVRDDLVDCQEGDMEINFDYKFETDGNGHEVSISDMMGEIAIYVFDQTTGILQDIKYVTAQEFRSGKIAANIPVGEYTLVAWGLGSQENLADGGFSDVQMLDPQTNDYVPVEIGRTTLNNFRLLIPNPENGGFDDLFHAVAENVVLGPKPEEPVQVDFDFVRYTNTVRLKIKGLEYLPKVASTRRPHPDLPLDIFVRAKQGTYTHKGQIDPYAPEQTYNALTRSLDETETEMDIKMLRIDVQRHKIDPVVLHMHDITADPNNDAEVHRLMQDMDVLKLIQQARDSRGAYLYQTQAQIDEEDIFDIAIAFEPDPDSQYGLKVTITVAGFNVIDVIPD